MLRAFFATNELVNQRAKYRADDRRNPEDPQLGHGPIPDKHRDARASSRINRRVRDRNADEVNQGETQTNPDWGESLGSALIGRTQDDQEKHHGHHDFRHERCNQAVLARRMLAKAIRSEAGGQFKSGLSAGDEIEDACSSNSAEHLRDDVRHQIFRLESPCRPQPNGYGRVKMATGDVPDGKRHRKDGQAERQGNAEQTNSHVGKTSGQDGASAAPENQPERPEKLCKVLFHPVTKLRVRDVTHRKTRRHYFILVASELGRL